MDNSSVLLRRLNVYCAQALAGAASLCHTRAHAEIVPEHWLLKLLEQGESDLTVLARRYEWDIDALFHCLLAYLDTLPRSLRGRPELSQALRTWLKQAWLHASLEENRQIRTVHLLMALIEMPQLLRCEETWPLFTLSLHQLAQLRSLLDEQSDERPEKQQIAAVDHPITEEALADSPVHAVVQQGQQNARWQVILDRFTQDITAQVRAGKVDPIFGRDSEIRQMVDILLRRRKNNPILIGEPGVGKTALVEGLAWRIVEGDVPENLRNVTLRTLDLGLLQAGAGVKGEFEQRLKNIIDAVQQSATPILLFIDEAHTIIGAGNQAGGTDAANLLKPALARGELRTIAATTWSEYKQYFERDAALERRFQRIFVAEPDDETAILMLRGLKSRYAQHHDVHITDDAVRAAVTLSRRYLTGRQLPDKAVDLLDTAAARIRVNLDTTPETITCLKAQRAALAVEQQALLEDIVAGRRQQSERLQALEQQQQMLEQTLQQDEHRWLQERELVARLLACQQDAHCQAEYHASQQALAELQQQHGAMIQPNVDVKTIANVVADWTGIPLSSLLKDGQSELLRLEAVLAERVVGQTTVLNVIAQRLRAAKTGLTTESGPQGVFLLVGPSGSGKTATALALADALFGGERSLITITLSEYQEPHTVSQLKGSPPGYVGYGQGGILTEAVRKRPYSVVLLDEVEKAHRDVMNLFYQVFDRGFMRDGEGREIDFRNTVILMTSNLGGTALMQRLDDQPETSEVELHALLRPILCDHFQPALLARFQTVIFRPLDEAAMRAIVVMKLDKVIQQLVRHYGIRTEIADALYDALTAACLLPDTGARNIDSLLNQQLLPVLSQQLLQMLAADQQPHTLVIDWHAEEGIAIEFGCDE